MLQQAWPIHWRLHLTPDLTVFAPTDDAFADLIATNDAFNSAADILALTNLGDILQYHVLDREVDARLAHFNPRF